MLKKAWKIVLTVVLALLVVVLGYVAYVFIDYHRIGNQELTVERNAAATVEAGKEYGILSYNIGFGAYEDDYSFFMDGGTESRAWSEERLTANIFAAAGCRPVPVAGGGPGLHPQLPRE